MAKALTSPLFLILFVQLIAVFVFLPVRAARRSPGPRRATWKWTVLAFATLLLWALSMPVVSSLLAGLLESGYPPADMSDLADIDVITVLSGGLVFAPSEDMIRLSESTYVRTMEGIRSFERSGARLLVMQGTLGGDDPSAMVERMKELALAFGVAEERIRTEPRSRNTWEHPIELLAVDGVDETTVLGVVTSAWHLPRALGEFHRYFDNVVPIPAEYYTAQLEGNAQDWIPDVKALWRSTNLARTDRALLVCRTAPTRKLNVGYFVRDRAPSTAVLGLSRLAFRDLA